MDEGTDGWMDISKQNLYGIRVVLFPAITQQHSDLATQHYINIKENI